MIEAANLTKRYGSVLAISQLTFTVRPGQVTGFLGPNGAGKSTAMRLMLGLERPTDGSVTIGGRPYGTIRRPLYDVGAVLDVRACHGGRSAYHHLLCLAQADGIGRRRVAEVLELVGLSGVARRRARTFSLGMSQRLGLAAALLGDPSVLICDEPMNGLDAEGIAWIRALLRLLAGEGRTVLVSSHLMSEMASLADHLIVIGQGRLLADASTAEILSAGPQAIVLVRTPGARPAGRTAGPGRRPGRRGRPRLIRGAPAGGAPHAPCARPGQRRHRGHRRPARDRGTRANPAARVAGVGLPGPDPRPPRPPGRPAGPSLTHKERIPSMNLPDLTVAPARPATIGFSNLLRSELTKLRSVRSTYWTGVAAAVASVAAAGRISSGVASLSRNPLAPARSASYT